MVGQNKIQNKINNISLSNTPKANLLIGKSGCGKHTIMKYISDKLNLPITTISNGFDVETLDNIILNPEFAIYVIDASELSERNQNAILKFIEEPLDNMYIFLLCDNKNSLLPTILNRCYIWEFESYSKQELMQFSDNELLLSVCETPGQIIKLKDYGVENIFSFASNIVDNLHRANVSNALTLTNKIAFKQEKDKIDFDVFLKVMLKILVDKWRDTGYNKYTSAYILTNNFMSNLNSYALNKVHSFEHYLLELKEALSSDNTGA